MVTFPATGRNRLFTSTNLQIPNCIVHAAVKALNQVNHSDLTLSSLTHNNRTHRIKTPLTHLQSPHNHPTSTSAEPHLCSTSSQHLLFISHHLARPPTSSPLCITDRFFQIPLLVSGINSLILSVNLYPVSLSLTCLFLLLPLFLLR